MLSITGIKIIYDFYPIRLCTGIIGVKSQFFQCILAAERMTTSELIISVSEV